MNENKDKDRFISILLYAMWAAYFLFSLFILFIVNDTMIESGLTGGFRIFSFVYVTTILSLVAYIILRISRKEQVRSNPFIPNPFVLRLANDRDNYLVGALYMLIGFLCGGLYLFVMNREEWVVIISGVVGLLLILIGLIVIFIPLLRR